MVKLAMFDIDRTLSGNNGRGHDIGLLASLQALEIKGIAVGLITGRDGSYAKAVNMFFDCDGPIIAENGCLLIPDLRNNKRLAVNYAGFAQDRKEYIRARLAEEGFLERMLEDRAKHYMITMNMRDDQGIAPDQIPYRIIEEHAAIYELFGQDQDIDPTHSSSAVDILPTGTSKGRTLRRYCIENNIDLGDVVMVGDSLNDVTAMRVVAAAGGLVGVVSDSTKVREALRHYSNVYYSNAKASSGTVEFIQKKLL